MTRALVLLAILCAPSSAWAQATATSASTFGTSCSYPRSALATHSEGTAFVSYWGTDDGQITHVEIVQSTSHADLDEATVQCVSNWRFDPKSDQHDVGNHRAGIDWKITSLPGTQSVGTWIGLPHICTTYYPKAEEKAGIEGTTRVSFTITSEGEVRDPAVEQSSGNAKLDDAALECVQSWRYRPAVQNGKPIAVRWRADIKFKPNLQPPAFAQAPRDCLHS